MVVKVDWKKIAQEPTEEEKEETNKVYEFFLQIAKEDKEVDWKELKEVLDFALKPELQRIKSPSEDRTLTETNATPSVTQTQNEASSNILLSLGRLICGALCKDSPLSDLIPLASKATPLNAALKEMHMHEFSKDICRSMIAMLDVDRSGKLGYEEFRELWKLIIVWKNVWTVYDTDNSGTFSGFELREALNSAGFKLNSRILNILMHRYGGKHGQIHFDDFMMCAVKLKTMIDIFKEKDVNDTNIATFAMEEWLEYTLYT